MLPCPVDPTEDQPGIKWGKSMEGFRIFGNKVGDGKAFLGNTANTIGKR